nr:hypothetical protein [Tanacetum cinerariifolium]
MTESPLMNSGFVVPVFFPGDDPIACLNKEMAFLTVVASLRSCRSKGFQTVKMFRQSFQTMLLFRLRILILMILTVMISRMQKRFSWPIFPIMVLTLSKRKRFVPQQELSADEAFWYHMLNPSTKSSDALHVKIEAPKELPKVSLMNESLKKLKLHLSNFDKVVKIRTTPNARTEGEWGFEHTKAVFNNEIIEVQTVFYQIDAAVQQSLVDKQCLEIAKKELLLENDRLLQQIMSQDILLTVMNSMSLIGESVNIERKRNKSCDKCFNLDAELLNHKIRIIIFWKVKGKEIVDIAAQKPSANTIVLGMLKLDFDLLAPKLLQNREDHIDYLKYTQEQADILQGIVEQAKSKQHLDNALNFACKHTQRIQELLVYVRDTYPNTIKLSAKKAAITPKNNVKKVRFAEPLTSSSNIKQVESSKTSDSNAPVLSPTGLKCFTSNCGSKPTGNKRNDRISQTPSRNIKNKVEAQPRKVNKKNCVVEPIRDVDVKHLLLNANHICATCKKSMFDGVHDMCLLDYVENVNSHAKSPKKHKKIFRKLQVMYSLK